MSRIAHISAAGGASGVVTVVGNNTPTDNYANPSNALNVVGLTMVWDGVTWDRWTGAVTATGAYTPIDTQTNPTNLVGVENFAMVWRGTLTNGTPNQWSRWGLYGIDDDATEGRVPGVAIFGRPNLNFGETPQQAGVVSTLTSNHEAAHGLRVVASDLYRPGSSAVTGRQNDSEVDANAVTQSGIVTPVVVNAAGTLDRVRGANSDNMAATGIPAAGNMIWDGATWDRWTGAVTVSNTVTVDTELPPAILLADNMVNPTVPQVGAHTMVWDGATWDRWNGTVALDATTLAALETVTVIQGTSPWVVSGSLTVEADPAAAQDATLRDIQLELRRLCRLMEILIGETPVFMNLDLESDG